MEKIVIVVREPYSSIQKFYCKDSNEIIFVGDQITDAVQFEDASTASGVMATILGPAGVGGSPITACRQETWEFPEPPEEL